MTADPVPSATPSAATTIPVPDTTDGGPCAKRIMISSNELRFKRFQPTRLLGRENARNNALDVADDSTDDLYPPSLLPLGGGIVRMVASLSGTTDPIRKT